MEPDNSLLDDLVRRIVEVVQPTRIVLFGSAARNQAGCESDLDVMVVVSDQTDQKQAVKRIYRNLIGFAAPVDVIVVTESDLRLYGGTSGLVYRSALRDGRSLYAA